MAEKILLVEDNEHNRILNHAVFEESANRCVTRLGNRIRCEATWLNL